MNIVPTIIAKEILSQKDTLNIVWTPCDNGAFTKYIQQLNHNLYNYENLYFGDIIPHLIICNNKMYSHTQVKTISLNYHLPVLVVDHTPKDKSVDINIAKQNIDNFKCCYRIAINNVVYNTWGQSHDLILTCTAENKERWNDILYNLAKRTYLL